MRLVPRNLDPYGLMVNMPFTRLRIALDPADSKHPGGRPPGASDPVVLELDLWAIIEELLPRFKAYAFARSKDPNAKAALALYEHFLRDLRSDANRARLQTVYEAEVAEFRAREAEAES